MPDPQRLLKGNRLIKHTSRKNSPPALDVFLFTHRQSFIFILVFMINLLLVSPSLMPEYSMVNPDDEAKYVESGWRLLRGDIREMAWGPLVALAYAPTHLIVGSYPDWFMLETWIGRLLLYSFMWWSILFLALQFKNLISPYIMLGILFVSTPFFAVVKNQSDAVFVGFSTLALAHLIKYAGGRNLKNLCLSSLFVGLGVLARVETIILLVTLTMFGLFIGWRRLPAYKILLSSLLPAVGVVGLFLLISLIMVGNFNFGVAGKSYDSFEVYQMLSSGTDMEQARQETRSLFGTQEENQGSVLRAIVRNPAAFFLRMLGNVKTIPGKYLDYFGKKLSPVLLVFAGWGVYGFIRKREIASLAILLLWPLHAFVPIGFLSFHVIPQLFYAPLLFGAVGITEIFLSEISRKEWGLFFIINLFILFLSLITNKPAFMFGFLLVVIVVLLSWAARVNWRLECRVGHMTVFLLLAIGLILREPFPFPNFPELGKTSSEQAIHYLVQKFPSQTNVLFPSPLPAIASKMAYVSMDDIPPSIVSGEDFWSWLRQENVQAIYLDSNRRVRNDIYDLFEKEYNQFFDRVYTSEENNIRIFLVN